MTVRDGEHQFRSCADELATAAVAKSTAEGLGSSSAEEKQSA